MCTVIERERGGEGGEREGGEREGGESGGERERERAQGEEKGSLPLCVVSRYY